MAYDLPLASQAKRPDDHAGALANPEQHLLASHSLSIQVQGKEGTWGHAVWALVREDRGKTRTLAVFEGTRRQAATHFFSYIHPGVGSTQASQGRATSPSASAASRGPRPGGRPSTRR